MTTIEIARLGSAGAATLNDDIAMAAIVNVDHFR
jgi:hypothetical protein